MDGHADGQEASPDDGPGADKSTPPRLTDGEGDPAGLSARIARDCAEDRALGAAKEIEKLRDEYRASPGRVGEDDARRMAQSIGLPVPRIILGESVRLGSASGAQKKRLRREIDEVLGETKEVGCIRIDAKHEGNPKTVYIHLGECKPDHDLTAELDKVYSIIPEDRRGEIRRHLSVLIFVGRKAYVDAAKERPALFDDIADHLPPESNPADMRIDLRNTTMYINPEWPVRVGILVRVDEKKETPG